MIQFCGSDWTQRVVPLDNYIGQYIWHMDFEAYPSAPGAWEARFKDVALVRADGTVKAVFNGQTALPGWYVWNYAGAATASIQPVAESGAAIPTSYYHVDHLGSARMMTNGYGYPVWQANYLPFGYEYSAQNTVNHYKFTGQERDAEIGLDHFLFRQYSSTQGRWLTPDPAGLAAVDPSNPQSWNRYAYVMNDPTGHIDPFGLTNVGSA